MTSEDDETELPSSLFERALMLQNMLVDLATGGDIDESLYLQVRKELLKDTAAAKLVPPFIRANRSSGALWGYFKSVSPKWQPRREHIWQSFSRLLDHLEEHMRSPGDAPITDTLKSFDSEGVHHAWTKALERRQHDPEGAITAARTLLETVCKRIIEETGESYGQNDDLPKLYHQTAATLSLAPSQHTETVFKSILGNCQQVVNNLGTLRNKIGDAHGQGKKPIKPNPRHAALAVNLAGAMATFLVETWQAKNNAKARR